MVTTHLQGSLQVSIWMLVVNENKLKVYVK